MKKVTIEERLLGIVQIYNARIAEMTGALIALEESEVGMETAPTEAYLAYRLARMSELKKSLVTHENTLREMESVFAGMSNEDELGEPDLSDYPWLSSLL